MPRKPRAKPAPTYPGKRGPKGGPRKTKRTEDDVFYASVPALAAGLNRSSQTISRLKQFGAPAKTAQGYSRRAWLEWMVDYEAANVGSRAGRRPAISAADMLAGNVVYQRRQVEPGPRGAPEHMGSTPQSGKTNWKDEAAKELALTRRYSREILEGRLCYRKDLIRHYGKHVRDASLRLQALPKLVSQLLTEKGLRQILKRERNPASLVKLVEDSVTAQVRDVLNALTRGLRTTPKGGTEDDPEIDALTDEEVGE